jgi:hypothetical protein
MRAAETISAARMMGEQTRAIPALGHPERRQLLTDGNSRTTKL